MIWIVAAAAFAQSPAHYSPDSIAQASELFRSYSEGLGPQFEALQNSLGRAGRGLEELEQSVLLLGERAPEEMIAYLEHSRRTANHAFLVAQEHVSLIEADSQGVFRRSDGPSDQPDRRGPRTCGVQSAQRNDGFRAESRAEQL